MEINLEPNVNADPSQTSNADNLDADLAAIPEKYRGKSVAEIARMHTEAEKALSRQGQELGEWRQIAQSMATGVEHSKTKKQEARKPVTTDELLVDPDAVLQKAIEENPSVKGTREELEQLRREKALNQFASEFPSYKDDIKDPEFISWIEKSPARSRLAIAADKLDIDAGRDLWNMWKDHKEVAAAKKEVTKDAKTKERKDKLSALSFEGPSGSAIDTTIRLNRSELVDLQRRAASGNREAQAKWNDPVFQKMRLQAYKDKRVD